MSGLWMRGRDPQSRPLSPPQCEDEAGTYGATGAQSSGQDHDRDIALIKII